MKKLALATLLALSTSAAFAGFNGNTAEGGFQGGNQGQQLTVKQALSAKDNSMITLVGNITQQIDGDEYVLNGRKCFITNGAVASFYCITAITDKEKGLKGISFSPPLTPR